MVAEKDSVSFDRYNWRLVPVFVQRVIWSGHAIYMAMVDWSPPNVTAHSEMPLLSTVH
jgi:hypothetical protein